MFTSSLIQKAYQLTENSDTRDKLRYQNEVTQLLLFNKSIKGSDFLTPLNFYLEELDATESALLPYMSEDKKNELLRNLQVTYLFLLAERKYELEHQKSENTKKYNNKEHLGKCQALIDAINYSKFCTQHQIKPNPERGYLHGDRPVAYMGHFAGHFFAQEMVNSTSSSKKIAGNMAWVNEKRLYWVWTSGLLKTMLELLPPDFFNGEKAKNLMRKPDPYTGTMSWGLYYFRFSLNLGLLLKHTLAGPWMSKEESSEPWTERFKTQWDQRKFSLLNDFIWATGNLLCFFLLVGKGAAGAWGDLLTLGLLIFDISLTAWAFAEQQTKHNEQMSDYETAMKQLKAQKTVLIDEQNTQFALYETHLKELHLALLTLEEDKADKVRQDLLTFVMQQQEKEEQYKQQLKELDIQLATLKRAKNKCARDWSYQTISLATNIAYAVGLMLAFILLTAPFLPLAAATLAAMTVAGAVLCFSFSIILNGIQSGIEIHKTKMTIKEAKAELKDKINDFKLLNSMGANEQAKKLIFLEIKKLTVETEYQEKMIILQSMRLLRSILIESLIPPLIFVSFVFLPLGPGAGILAAALALSVVTHFLIEHFVKKIANEKEKSMPPFNEQEYQKFCAAPENWGQQPQNGFFKAEQSEYSDYSESKSELTGENTASILPLLSAK